MAKLSVVVAGQKSFGRAALELVLSLGHSVPLVVSPWVQGADGRPGDRCTRFAHERGLSWSAGDNLAQRIEALPERPDVILAAHSHAFISRRARNATRLGAFGYHPSLLPRHRGRDAVRWTVHMRDPIAGGSVYWFTDNVDGGPIAAQGWCHVDPSWSATDLWREELFPLGLDLLERTLGNLEAGIIVAIPQDERFATWEPSWERPPLHRPDLPELGHGPNGFRTVAHKESLGSRVL